MSKWSTALAAHSPLSWLRLADAAGATAVAAAGSNGAYVNSPTLGVKGLLAADTDKAVTLARASSQRITVPDGASTDISDASFTLGCWVKLASQPASGQFFTIAAKTNAAGSNESYSIDYRNESGTVRLACGVRTSGGFTTTKAVKTLTTGTGYFLTYVYDGVNQILYVDGVELVKGAKTGNVSANNELLYWGAYNNVDHFDGTIDEVFLLPGALSAAQVKALFESASQSEGQQVTLGQATETDSAQALSFTKTIRKTLTPGIETDAGQVLSRAKRVVMSSALEVDAAQAIPRAKRLKFVVAAEADAATGLVLSKRMPFGLATELESARAILASKRLTLVTAAESNVSLALSARRSVSFAPSAESDATVGVVPVKTIYEALAQAAETNLAAALATVKRAGLGPAHESDAASGVVTSKRRSLVAAIEEDVASSASVLHRASLVPASQVDAALSLAWTHFAALAPAAEHDQAQELSYRSASGPIVLLPAVETEQAVALDFGKPIHVAPIPALAFDAARPLRVLKPVALSAAAETDAPLSLKVVQRVGVLPGVETSTALPVQVFRHISLAAAVEAGRAQPLDFLKPIDVLLQPSVEIDEALELLLGEVWLGSFLVSAAVLPGVLVASSAEALTRLSLAAYPTVRLEASAAEAVDFSATQFPATTLEVDSE